MQCKSKSKASVTQHRTIASSPFGTFPSRKSFLLDRFPVCQSFNNDGYFLALDEEKRDLNCSLFPQPHTPPVLWSENLQLPGSSSNTGRTPGQKCWGCCHFYLGSDILHAEDQRSFSVASVGVPLVAVMSGKVTLFISGISGSKEVFFANLNDSYKLLSVST